MSKKHTEYKYQRNNNYWDFTRNMSPKQIKDFEEKLKELEKNRKLHDKYWKDHESTDDSSSVSNSTD
jgi:inorganic pyrophosphatase